MTTARERLEELRRREARERLEELRGREASVLPPDNIDQIPEDWATSEMPAWKRALAGSGKFFSDVGTGGRDIAIDYFGSDEEQQRNNEQIALAQERDVQLMNDPYALSGNIVTGVGALLPTMAIPGANTLVGSALAGGAYGALQPTATDQSRGANIVLGSGGGGIGYGAGKAVGAGLQTIAPAISVMYDLSRPPIERATRKLSEALRRDIMEPEKLASNLRKMGPQATIADAGGENVLGLADAALQAPGISRNQALAMLSRRQLGKTGRTMDALSDSIGDEKNFYAVLDDITANLKSKSSPLYKEAFDSNMDMSSRLIDRLLKTPIGKKAFAGARERMENKMAMLGKPEAELTEQMRFLSSIDRMDKIPMGVSKGLKLRTLDFIKQELDDTVTRTKKLYLRGDARKGEYLDALDIKNKFVKELDSLDVSGGKYARARKIYAGDAQNREALENGRNFFKDDAEITEKLLSSMSQAERENFRAGAMRAVRDKIESAPEGGDVYKRIFGNETIKKKLRTIFPDSRSYASFARKIKTEADFFKTRARVTGGGAQQLRSAQEVDIGIDPEYTAGAVLSPWYATARAGMRLLQNRGGLPEDVRNELGGMLFEQSPQIQRKILSDLLKGRTPPSKSDWGISTGSVLSKPATVLPFLGGEN